ncbi:hypothetical protein GLOIN_2v1783668 [Rhizophagus clarus]|uniref:SWIM-type domain-containing protein n=1 Tax=Rhizophagus clarus TaxID=94130 RepID=A0A8H3LTS8_9GLOM|nr:hypothetical protein GLOIN_2v1783668 [Rhizophagus clarus]
MERFYIRRLIAIASKHPGHLPIARRFLCPGWEKVNANSSTQNNELFYIVNSEIGVCTCLEGMSGVPYKHQGAVAMKFHISIFNFIPTITANDRMIYSYIAFGWVAENNSFYATEQKELEERREPEKDIDKIDNSAINTILEEIRADYQSGGLHL